VEVGRRSGGIQLDHAEGEGGRPVGVTEAMEHGGETHELEGGQRLEGDLLLGHQPDVAGQAQVAPGVPTEDAHGAACRSGQPTQHPQNR